jgi:hypothetical protein
VGKGIGRKALLFAVSEMKVLEMQKVARGYS